MRTLYLDIFSGISGNMFLGALIDLGMPPQTLEQALRSLPVEGWRLSVERGEQRGIHGAKVEVLLESNAGPASREKSEPTPSSDRSAPDPEHSHSHGHSHARHGADPGGSSFGHRTFADVRALITASTLSPWVKEKALAVFGRIAAAEGKVHGLPADRVHFHEVGAVDSIVDIVGACVGIEWLGKPRILAAPVVEGTGWIDCAHGRFPVPAPATIEILGARGVALSQCEEPFELVTPTGAGLLAEFVETFGSMQDLVLEKIGYGLGTRVTRTRPNVLRAVLGGDRNLEPSIERDWETDRIAVLETNLDDLTPEILGGVLDRTLAAGALDVFHTPVQMKKGRPGVLLTVLCAPDDADRFTELLLRETTTFGVRRTIAERRKLKRRFEAVETPFGRVNLKLGLLNDEVVQVSPEYDACRKLADRAGVPIRRVFEAAKSSRIDAGPERSGTPTEG